MSSELSGQIQTTRGLLKDRPGGFNETDKKEMFRALDRWFDLAKEIEERIRVAEDKLRDIESYKPAERKRVGDAWIDDVQNVSESGDISNA